MPAPASSATLYSHIDRAYREFVDVAALVARQSAAEDATAATTIPVLQQMIEQKQKGRERLKREAQRIQNEQEAGRQEITNLDAGVANERSLSGNVAGNNHGEGDVLESFWTLSPCQVE
ncbi:hypothetical protein BN1723_006238 [Verticillium longisporum]|uniref:Uncharacterized protein n=1 Tax=Verticillium longisporum TaxID=100787 RepID=A0A0G4NEB8_VERLO|nr:hypothetical protein BN1708_010126 [Verticillium longisporum]CRK44645.1 hypothetical protein BN1723_006238 [Verticillium longisporum]